MSLLQIFSMLFAVFGISWIGDVPKEKAAVECPQRPVPAPRIDTRSRSAPADCAAPQ